MSSDNHTQWTDAFLEHQDDVLLAFLGRSGQIVIGRVDNWIDYCSEAGGAAISKPATKKIVGDTPVYMCTPLPGSNLSAVRSALLVGSESNATGWFGVLSGISSNRNSAHPAAFLPSQMDAWWWLPLLGSMAIAVIA